MNKKYFILLFALFFLIINFVSATTNISVCPYTITVSGDYVVNQSISGTGTCITVNADNVDINCQGNTISYGSDGVATRIGITATHGVIPRTNLTIRNCIINDINASGPTGYGILMTRFSNSYIFNNTIQTNGTLTNHGIFLTTSSNNNVIENNTVTALGTSTGNFGIHLISSCVNNTIKGNTVTATGTTTSYALYLLTNSDDNTVTNNSFYSTQTNATGNIDGNTVHIYRSKNNKIIGNYIYGYSVSRNYAVYIREEADNTEIINNTIINNATTATNYGVYLTYSDSSIIEGNNITVYGTTTLYGIYPLSSHSNTIKNNNITVNGTLATNYGIYLGYSDLNTFEGNNMSVLGTTPLYGIHLQYSEGNTFDSNNANTYGTTANAPLALGIGAFNNSISNNTFISSGTLTANYGAYLTQCTGNIIDGNNFSTNGTSANYGIYMLTSVKENIIRNNNITTDGTTANYGFFLSDALYNEITGNNISTGGRTNTGSTNNWGINLASNSIGNKFYNNTVNTSMSSLNYGVQLLTNSNENIFRGNNVYPSGNGTSNIGFYVSASHNNTFEGNTISTNGSGTDYGFYLHSSSRNNLIKDNIISTIGVATSHAFDFVFITPGYPENNTLQNNTLLVINGKDLVLETASTNNTWLADQSINNYTITTSAIINFRNTSAGEIKFTQMLTSTSGTNLTDQIYINENLASINESNAGFNKTAEITLYNRPTTLSNLSIYRNGGVCLSAICTNLTPMNAGNVTFNVTMGGNYSINSSDYIAPVISLNLPSEPFNTSSQSVSFNFTATDETSTNLSCKIYLDGVINQTNSSVNNGSLTNFDISGISEASHNWSVRCFDEINNSGVSETKNFTIAISTPTIILNYPLSDAYLDNTSFTWLNYTVYDSDLRSMTVWLYGDGNSINTTTSVQNGTPLFYNWTGLTLGQHNWTAITNNGIKNSSTYTKNFNIINLTLNCEAGGPYQDGALVLVQGNLSNGTYGLSSQVVNASIYVNNILNTSKSLISSSDGSFQTTLSNLGVGNYTLNVLTIYQGISKSCSDSFVVGGAASLVLDKIASFYNVTNETFIYNMTLRLTNKGGSNATNVNITDLDYLDSIFVIGNLSSGESVIRSYLLNYTKNSTTYYNTTAIAQALGIDSYLNSLISANSTAINLTIPDTTAGIKLTIIKNIAYTSGTNDNVTYNVSDEIVNSGDRDLINIIFTDQDVGALSLSINISEGNSYTLSSLKTINREATNSNHEFIQATSSVLGEIFNSSQPVIRIPGKGGGPNDVKVYPPSSVSTSTSFNTVINVTNQNPDISQDFVIDYWITNDDETTNYSSSGQQTIYIAALETNSTTVTLTSPSSAGTYRVKASVSGTGVVTPATSYGTFTIIDSSSETPSTSGTTTSSGSSRITAKAVDEVICNPPYIRYGKECCLDQNKNNICDSDDDKKVEQTPEIPKTGEVVGKEDSGQKFSIKMILDLWWILVLVLVVLVIIYSIKKYYENKSKNANVNVVPYSVYKSRKIEKTQAVSNLETKTSSYRSKPKSKKLILVISLVAIFVVLGFFVYSNHLIVFRAIDNSSLIGNHFIINSLLIVSLLVVVFVIFFLIRKLFRKKRDTSRLREIIGMSVYTNAGNKIGKLKDIYLDNNNSKINYFLISLNKKLARNLKKKNILVDYKHVKSIKEIIIIEAGVFNALSNFLATTDKDLNNKV